MYVVYVYLYVHFRELDPRNTLNTLHINHPFLLPFVQPLLRLSQ
jgi:hypothetical protein